MKPRHSGWTPALVTLAICMAPASLHGQRKPEALGTHWAVSTRTPEASLAAASVLERGGNAFDAAVAAKVIMGIVDSSNNTILGADAQIMLWHAGQQKVIGINASGWAPELATIDWYNQNSGGEIPVDHGLLSGTVPGDVDTWAVMLSKYGTMTLEQVLMPAIEMLEQGVPRRNAITTAKLYDYPSSVASLFGHHPQGQKAWAAGEVFTWPDVARTLRKMVETERANASKGRPAAIMAARDRFYKGDIAQEMAAFSEANGGLFRYRDFADYSVEIVEPVRVNYRGYDVWASPTASQGPTLPLWLSLLEGYDLKSMGHNSVRYLHVMQETMKLAYADRDLYMGDWNFDKIPFEVLLSDAYAAERRKLVDLDRATNDMRPGIIPGYPRTWLATPTSEAQSLALGHNHTSTDIAEADRFQNYYNGTSYLSVIDKDGNLVSWKPSSHTSYGTGVAMGTTGVIFNCRGDYFNLDPRHVNSLRPHKRPRSTLMATLITKDGKPFMAVGSPGGDDQPQREIQAIVNVIDFGMRVQQAVDAPAFTSPAFPASPFPQTFDRPGIMRLEGRIPAEVGNTLRSMGHDVEVIDDWGRSSALSIIVRDPVTGVFYAGADTREQNVALAR